MILYLILPINVWKWQIDELVAQAFTIKATEHGTKEIETFTNVISEMLSSLKV